MLDTEALLFAQPDMVEREAQPALTSSTDMLKFMEEALYEVLHLMSVEEKVLHTFFSVSQSDCQQNLSRCYDSPCFC